MLNGCNVAEKLSTVGEMPDLTQIQDPTLVKGYRPISMPMPNAEPQQRRVNSLWETGSRAFFKDQRANKVGDILTVLVNVNDKAQFQDTPKLSRQTTNSAGATNFLGLESKIGKVLPKTLNPTTLIPSTLNPSNLINYSSNPTLNSNISYDRKDKVSVKVAATIIQILPNGNMYIKGRQELRLFNEVREVEIVGIIRPQDVSSSNTIPYEKIAEARISYAGRGDISDMYSFPVGQQILNKISPF